MSISNRAALCIGALCFAMGMPSPAVSEPQLQTDATVPTADKPVATRFPSIEQTAAIAEEGYIFGLPIVMNYAVMYDYAIDHKSGEVKAPFNQISNHSPLFSPGDIAIVNPGSDTPYVVAWLDLRSEPVVLSVPAVEPGRYYSVMLADGNTYTYGHIGTRATGTDAGDYLVVGPKWGGVTPPGIKGVFRSGTQFSLALYRTQLVGAGDMAAVEAVQAGYTVQPLSAYLGQPAAPAVPAIRFPGIDKAQLNAHFFEYLDYLLQFVPPTANETEIRAKLARIGVGAGKSFYFRELSPGHQQAVKLGVQAGEARIASAVAEFGEDMNGWRVITATGDSAHYNANWLQRAAATRAVMYGNDLAEAVYTQTHSDVSGEALDGSKANYTLTFPTDQLPPVNAFWSVSLYDGNNQLPGENPLNRHFINSSMLGEMKPNEDGSLTIYIQQDSPGEDRLSNWLPAPGGPISLVMHLYWPRLEPPSILPLGAGEWQPPGIVKVQ